jgi:serine/threonine protein kinase
MADSRSVVIRPPSHTLERCVRSSERATLYTASRHADRRRVILKCYRQAGAEALRRAERERDLLARIDAPDVVAAPALIQSPDGPVLEFARVPGRSLARVLAQGRLAPDAFLALAVSLVTALEHVHRAGLIHRDLRPEHVIVARDGAHLCLVELGASWSSVPRVSWARHCPPSPSWRSRTWRPSRPAA